MKNKKLNYAIAFDGNVVSKEEQLKLFAKLIFCLRDLHESDKLKDKDCKSRLQKNNRFEKKEQRF